MGHCHPLADCSQVTSSLAITLTKYPTSIVYYNNYNTLEVGYLVKVIANDEVTWLQSDFITNSISGRWYNTNYLLLS